MEKIPAPHKGGLIYRTKCSFPRNLLAAEVGVLLERRLVVNSPMLEFFTTPHAHTFVHRVHQNRIFGPPDVSLAEGLAGLVFLVGLQGRIPEKSATQV